MKVLELVESARKQNEDVFKDVSDERSAKIVTEALRDLMRRLEAESDAGRLNVAGVGSFMVKEDAKGGKRIVLRPASGGAGRAKGRRGQQEKQGRAAEKQARANDSKAD